MARVKNEGPLILEEMQMIEVMIKLYYSKNASIADVEENRMLTYAMKRLQYCQFGEKKTTCQKCPVHCYQPRYKEQMKQVMRYSGPRMLFKHPVLTLKHGFRGLTRKVVVN
ncbi:nitrous oxide-stimulated promoter family protein [Vagococcus fessus]|uniref:Nitrous oxide-stimulated promoter family protein n=1 Tax=Vagococcus fessus TaxID=120370 RepID=A0A430AB95_9ENTE|nr:nitrous oxide-stimulated promoter family protein [Vagococcus fessus]RSU04505.1 hypothetical protein CBF31_00350 [Vagococcus fessus]